MAQTIDLHPECLAAVRAGAATSTVRVADDVAPGPVRLVFVGEQTTATVTATVTAVVPARLSEVGDDAVRTAGYTDRADLVRRLAARHPGLADDGDVTVVHFVVTV